MKVAFISKYNDGYLKQLKEKKLSFRTFNEGIEYLKNDFYYHYGSLAYYLEEHGIKSQIFIPNFDQLQTLWRQENKSEAAASMEIVKAQILHFNADIVFLNSNFEYFDALIPFLKEHKIKVCAWISCPIPKGVNLSGLDHIFTLFEPHFELFKQLKIRTTLTHGGFDERALINLNTEKKYPLTFIGGIGKAHKKREEFLKKISKAVPLMVWGYGYRSNKHWKTFIKSVQHQFAFNNIFKGEAWGKEMFNVLSQSKMTLNYHGDIAVGHSVNMRLFEATGVGTLLLTENNTGISHFFIPDKEVVVFESTDDAIKKINYYLANPAEAAKIAKAGQAKTLEKYNYKNMISTYINVFEQLLADEK